MGYVNKAPRKINNFKEYKAVTTSRVFYIPVLWC